MINTQVIKSKIIDLALRGQLTEQLPEDGTAENLYQQLIVEIEEKFRQEKTKKAKPLPDIDEKDIPFEIPHNWKWIRFVPWRKNIL